MIVDGDAAAADRRLAEIAAVTPADIQRVARRWLREEASAAVRYLPEEGQNGAREDSDRRPPRPSQAAALAPPADIRIVQPAPEAERVAPPPVAAGDRAARAARRRRSGSPTASP